MRTVLGYVKCALLGVLHLIMWVLNLSLTVRIRVWYVLAAVAITIGAALTWLTVRSLDSGGTKPQPDTPIPDIKRLDIHLEAFRQPWDIYGRFEQWPAVLPLAEMSKAAYSCEGDAKPVFQRHGLKTVVAIDSPFHSQCAYVAYADDVLVIAFRGTDDTEDWFFNGNMYPHKMAEGGLHGGFGCAYGTVQSRVQDEIAKANPKHIWVTGHSLGGAMALVCAYDLAVYQDRKIDGVITFGQPRIAKPNLSACLRQKLGDRYVHFINELDSVPQIPPGFQHFGLELHFLNGKVWKSEDFFPKLAMAPPGVKEPGKDEYVPSKGVPEMSQKDFEAFMRKHRQAQQEKEQQEEKLDDKHGHLRVGSGPPVCAIPFPWVDNHSMDLYVKKIKAAIDKASGG